MKNKLKTLILLTLMTSCYSSYPVTKEAKSKIKKNQRELKCQFPK